MKKKGFTLVELSIVLVIIGLLIGGILTGQSLIESVKINKQVRQIQQFDIAVGSFISKYNSIPGDSVVMGCTTTGCGDGNIDDWYTTGVGNGLIWSFAWELTNFWPHLGNSGFMKNEGVTFTPNLVGGAFNVTAAARNSPQATIDSKTGIIAGTSRIISYGNNDRYSFYQLADYSAYTASPIQAKAIPSITPAQALAIDSKMDDGMPNIGIVRATRVGGAGNFYFASYDWGQCNNATGTHQTVKYKTTDMDVKACGLNIQIMSQSGGIPIRSSKY
jgi:prepilin-type N-terminal cleavage/methylation domain-containing protein